jgi:hypothetical protein
MSSSAAASAMLQMPAGRAMGEQSKATLKPPVEPGATKLRTCLDVLGGTTRFLALRPLKFIMGHCGSEMLSFAFICVMRLNCFHFVRTRSLGRGFGLAL